LAKELEVSRQYVARVEQGLYEKPNHKLVNWASEVLNVKPEEIIDSYSKWQWEHRFSVKNSKMLRPVGINPHYNPDIIYYHKLFRDWRDLYWKTAHEFSVDMCMHPYPVTQYEQGESYKMPALLKEVMSKLGLIGEGFKTSER
jgi:transcriptional regulator with XRE-family HTH domain